MKQLELKWQSKVVLLAVVPYVGAGLVVQTHWWVVADLPVAIWTLSLSLLLGGLVLAVRAATMGAAATGFAITASLMFSTATLPYAPWRTALTPVLAVSLLTYLCTRVGRGQKEALGVAEGRSGRDAAQVAANLGVSALASSELAISWMSQSGWLPATWLGTGALYAVGLAALAEAAADTVSSELGQVLGGVPRMITTMRTAKPGSDGAISVMGSLAGVAAAILIAGVGTWALQGDRFLFEAASAGGIFGLFFDSLLGATLELRGRLNNDAVNFLSTVSAAMFGLGVLVVLARV